MYFQVYSRVVEFASIPVCCSCLVKRIIDQLVRSTVVLNFDVSWQRSFWDGEDGLNQPWFFHCRFVVKWGWPANGLISIVRIPINRWMAIAFMTIFNHAACGLCPKDWWHNELLSSKKAPKITFAKQQQLHCCFVNPYCWWLKSCTTWDVWNPINNGKNYQPQLVSRISAINSSGRWRFSWDFPRSQLRPRSVMWSRHRRVETQRRGF